MVSFHVELLQVALLFFARCSALSLGFLEAIVVVLDVDNLGVMSQAVDEGNDKGCVGEYFRPIRERFVGGHQCALLLVPTAGQLEEQIGSTV